MKDIQTFRLADADKITNLPLNTVDELLSKEDKINKGQPNGYASLGNDGKVPSSQLPYIGGGDMLKSVYDAEGGNRQVAFKNELSDENFTTAEKNKLAGIEEGAEVNNISDTQAYDLTAGLDTSLHSHNNMYYTENEVDTLLSNKVVGPASSTDNAIVRYNGTTGKLIENSSATIDNLGNILATNLSGINTGDETKATIESKLIGDISSHTHNSQLSKVYGTGVTSYITLTFTATTFSISDGTGVITNGLTGAISNVSWSGLNNVTDNFPTSDTTWLLINSSGVLTQQASIPTPNEYRTKILVGAIGKNAGNIIFGRTVTLPQYDGINTITDISTFLGAIQDGNINILGTGTLSVNYTAGKVFSLGANATTSVYGPNIVPLPSQTPAILNAVYRNGTGGWTIGPNVTVINSAFYDNGTGTLASVVPSKYTIKVFYLSSTGKVYVQQGQNIYNSLSEATAAVNTEIRENWPYGSSLVKLGYLVIKSGATATNNTTDCAIINLGKFGTGGGGGGSGGVTDHNSLTGIQGGAIGDYQHLTTAQVTNLNNQSGVNTGDNATNSQYSGLATSKQDTLISGTNIKTINGNSLLGSGDLVITSGASFNGINGQSFSFPGEIVPGKIAELTAFNSGTFAEMQISTLTRTTGTTTLTVKKNGTTIGTATITSSTSVTNGRYYGTSTDLADSFVANDVITIEVADNGMPGGTGLLINLK